MQKMQPDFQLYKHVHWVTRLHWTVRLTLAQVMLFVMSAAAFCSLGDWRAILGFVIAIANSMFVVSRYSDWYAAELEKHGGYKIQ